MSILFRLWVVLLTVLALSGCAPHRADLLLDTGRVPAGELARIIRDNDARVTGLSGSGSVAFESSELSGSVFFTISLRKPDSLLIRFEGPFGMDAGFFFLSRSSYVIYNRLENVAFTGVPTAAGIRSVLPLSLTVDELIDAFTGTFRLPGGAEPSVYSIEGNLFRLRYDSPEESKTFWVDPSSRLVTRYRSESGGSPVFEAEASLPVEQDDRCAPRQIIASFPLQSGRLSVYYSSITLNPAELSFTYTIPRSAQRRTFTKP